MSSRFPPPPKPPHPDQPLLHIDKLLGERQHSRKAKLFYPSSDQTFELVPVRYIQENIWRSPRRRVEQSHFSDDHSLVTVLIPFLEPGAEGSFELVWLFNGYGQTAAYSRDVEEARATHERWVTKALARGLELTML